MSSEAPKRAVCGAALRNKPGEFCRSTFVMPNGRCRIHGGLTPTGPALPQYTHGRYSKHMPRRLRERVLAALDDPELGEVRLDLATIDELIGDAMPALTAGGTAATWRRLRTLAGKYPRSDSEGREALVEQMLDLIGRGADEAEARAEVVNLIDRRVRVLDHEVRRTTALQGSMSADRVLALASALAGMMQRYVTDPDALAAIRRDLRALDIGFVDRGGNTA